MERVGFVHSLKMIKNLDLHLRIVGSNPCGSFISSTFFYVFDRQNGWSAQFIHCCAQSSHSIGYLHLHRFVSMPWTGATRIRMWWISSVTLYGTKEDIKNSKNRVEQASPKWKACHRFIWGFHPLCPVGDFIELFDHLRMLLVLSISQPITHPLFGTRLSMVFHPWYVYLTNASSTILAICLLGKQCVFHCNSSNCHLRSDWRPLSECKALINHYHCFHAFLDTWIRP